MQTPAACPELSQYKKLASGQLSSPEQEAVLDHLETCQACVQRVESLTEKDTLVDLIRQARTLGEGPTGETVARLVERLRKLRPSAAAAPEAPAPIRLACSGCGKYLKIQAALAGKKVKCPHCSAVLAVPSGEAAPDHDAADSVAAALTVAPASPAGDDSTGTASDHAASQLHTATNAGYDFLAAAQSPDELGRLGPYRILRQLGAGGMGVVFQAEDPDLQRLVAIKAMLPGLAASDSAKQRFLREARAAAAVKHDHIVIIHQVGEDRGTPYLAMEFLDGEPLDDRLKREGKLPVAAVLRIGREMAEGLAAAHERGLIHRDIKPANVWLEGKKGRVKILDFGLARAAAGAAHLTQSGAIVGTPAYMAPEQARGKEIDQRCDLFSLGCVLYRMATGETPFRGTDVISTLMAVATETPRPPHVLEPGLPKALSDLIVTLLAKEAADRPASAQAVAAKLDRIAQATARPAMAVKPRKRWPIVAAAVVAAAVAFLALVAAGIVFFMQTPEGVVRIEIDDPEIKLSIEGHTATITNADTQPITLTPGKHGLTITRGDFTFNTASFELAKRGRTSLKITWHAGQKMVVAQDGMVIGEKAVPPVNVAGGPTEDFVPLFNGRDLKGWRVESGEREQWKVENGVLVARRLGTQPDGALLSDRDFTNFVLRFEYRPTEAHSFSWVVFRSAVGETELVNGQNLPMHPNLGLGRKTQWSVEPTGRLEWALGRSLPANKRAELKDRNEWNEVEVQIRNPEVRMLVNGDEVATTSLDEVIQIADAHQGYKRRSGRIGFQAREGESQFRNIRIKELPPAEAPLGLGGPPMAKRFPVQLPKGNANAKWCIIGKHLVQPTPNQFVYLFFGDLGWTDYDFSVEAQRISGNNEFALSFRSRELKGPGNGYGFSLGWLNTANLLGESVDGKQALLMKEPPPGGVLNSGEWYTARVEVRGKGVKCFLDGRPVFSFDAVRLPSGGVGLRTCQTAYVFRNIRVTSPDGKVLLEGMPDLGGSVQPPAVGAAPEGKDFLPLFNGKDLTGWRLRDAIVPNGWTVANQQLVCSAPHVGNDLITQEEFTDFMLHIEFQATGNSGVFLQGRHEIQIQTLAKSDPPKYMCGAIYGQRAPSKNMGKAPTEWQSFDIAYRAPRGKGGIVTTKARVTLIWNGEKVHDNVEIDGPSGGSLDDKVLAPGPLLLQGDHDRVVFRNIRIKRLAPEGPATFKHSVGMEFVLVPKGKAWLGGGAGKPGEQQETIADDFYLGKYVVTQGQWKAVMGPDNNPSWFARNGGGKDDVKFISDAELDQFPVESLPRNEFKKFLARLNTSDSSSGWCYRLPTEVEWEYACRGGANSREESAFDYYFDRPTNDLSSEQADFNGDRPAGNAAKGKFLQRTCKVGSYPPNRLGLYDMHGNVWQQCDDAEFRLRGGGYFDFGSVCRAANRRMAASNWHGYLGYRVARVPVAKEAKPASGFVPLFNGKDLTGWTPAPQSAAAWFVDKEGSLTGWTGPDGAPAGLLSQRGDYTDFHIRSEVMINVGDGGLQFRFPRDKSERPAYHAHIATRGQWQTGGLSRQSVPLALACPIYPLKTVPNAVVPANTWFTFEVIAVGDHIELRVDGETTADVRDPPGARAGHIVLQVVYQGSMIKFRKVEIKELTPTK